jgi:hypothetical protein
MAISRDPANIAAIREAFIAAVNRGHSDTSAAGFVGISPQTIRDWKHQGRCDIEAGVETLLSAFVEGCARASASRIERHLLVVEEASVNGDVQSSRWLLAAYDREHFGTASKVQLTGADDGPVKVSHSLDLSKLTDDELAAALALASKVQGG